jgi:PAS domain-containing protein
VPKRAAALAEIARFPEMNPGPVLRLNEDGVVLLANAAAENAFGERLLGSMWLELCPGVDAEQWRRILAASDIVPVEARLGNRDFVFNHRRDAQSHLVFVFGSDLTKQKQAERALRQSEKMATLGTLAAGVAHELNNPAAATSRAAEQLREAFARLEQAHLALEGLGLDEAARQRMHALDRQARTKAASHSELSALRSIRSRSRSRGLARPTRARRQRAGSRPGRPGSRSQRTLMHWRRRSETMRWIPC